MKEGSGRRKYDKQFKEEAIGLVIKGGRSVPDVASGLGIHENLLYKWKKQYDADPGSYPGKGHLKPQDEEFRKLQKENANLKEYFVVISYSIINEPGAAGGIMSGDPEDEVSNGGFKG